MAIVIRIISADGKKVVSKTLPGVPSKLKVPEGARVEVVDKETGRVDTLARYVNDHSHKTDDKAHDPDNPRQDGVVIETENDWGKVDDWLGEMRHVAAPSRDSTETKLWFDDQPDHHETRVGGMSANTLLIGAGVGAALIGGGVALASSGGSKDTIAPLAPTGLDLATEDDNGASNNDNVTTLTSGLTISGSAEPGSKVELYDGTTSLGKVTAGSDGKFTKDLDLAEGAHVITATSTDKAGNTSSSSSALVVRVDKTAPVAPTALDLATADDTGSSSTDNITRQTSALTITGTAEASSTVELFDGTTSLGTATTSTTGTFTKDIALTEGVHAITVKATDAAGNASPSSDPLSITIDTTAPAAPTGLDLATEDDDGTSSTDNITSLISDLTFSGLAEAGSTVDLMAAGVKVGSVIADSTGHFTLDVTMAAGTHLMTARATDVAGNTGASSTILSVQVGANSNVTDGDTTPPVGPGYEGGSANAVVASNTLNFG